MMVPRAVAGGAIRLLLLALLLALPAAVSGSETAPSATPRVPTVAEALARQSADLYSLYERDLIDVKFKDGQQIRLRGGRPVDLRQRALRGPRAVEAVSAVVGGTWTRGHAASEATLDRLRAAGEQRGGAALPDLNLYFRLRLPAGTDALQAIALFERMPEVEGAYLVSRPVPPPAVPDFSIPPATLTGDFNDDIYQGYLDVAPAGVDARYAWEGTGGTGSGVKICDVEYAFNRNHADLPTISVLGDDPLNPLDNPFTPFGDDHGTAVFGEMAGRNNGFGVRGIAYGATYLFAHHTTIGGGTNVAQAITNCLDVLDAGDVILLEAQTNGPNRPLFPAEGDDSGLVPVEWDKPVYDAIKTAVAAGIIVVEAGGNGGEDLDDDSYDQGHRPFQAANDSGAIIVGSGQSFFWGDDARNAWETSSFGATVDLQGWGDSIASSGYGNLYDEEGRNLLYTGDFGGTSGASPIVAASAAIVQSTFRLANDRNATPDEVKTILRSTGTAQRGTRNIGPLPNLRAAIDLIWDDPLTAAPPIITPAEGIYQEPVEVRLQYPPGHTVANSHIRYTLDGSEPTPDSLVFLPDEGDLIYLRTNDVVKAKTYLNNPVTGRQTESATASATYVIQDQTPTAAKPVITVSGGANGEPTTIAITSATPGAIIRYTTDGSTPWLFSRLYSTPLQLSPGTYTIKAKAYRSGYYTSDTATLSSVLVYPPTLPAPSIVPNGGTYYGPVVVSLESSVLGEIHYTTDGTFPRVTSPLYSGPFELTSSATVQAALFRDGLNPSGAVSAAFTVHPGVATPAITPNGGAATGSLQVSLSTSTPGATIRYTTNGAQPESFSPLYTGPIVLGVGQHTVRARGFLEGRPPSEVASAAFTVFESPGGTVADPSMTPFSTEYFVEPFTVTMHTDTAGATIHYTVKSDGTAPGDPTTGDPIYSGPISINAQGDYRFKMRAFKQGMSPSNVVPSGQLTLDEALGTTQVPGIHPPGGTFTNPIGVTFTAGQFETIFYTLDGSQPVTVPPPTLPSRQYDQGSSPPVQLASGTTVKATAYRPFFASGGTATAAFFFVCDTPSISPEGGPYQESVNVTLSTGTANAAIFYTTDGSEPTTSSTLYQGPFTLGIGETTVKARCLRQGFEESETATDLFLVHPAPVAPAIGEHPQSQTVDEGTDVTFAVQATGVPTPTYQWQRDGADLGGEIGPELFIPNAQPGDTGIYRVVVSNNAGSVISDEAALVVVAAPPGTAEPTATGTLGTTPSPTQPSGTPEPTQTTRTPTTTPSATRPVGTPEPTATGGTPGTTASPTQPPGTLEPTQPARTPSPTQPPGTVRVHLYLPLLER